MIEPTPWMIDGGPLHTAALGRSLAHMSLGGKEGVAEPGDLAVRATASASPTVRVAAGTFAINNTYADQFGQTYVGRAPSETISPAFAPTTTSARSDMLIMRIDDPEYGGTVPEDPAVGVYERLEILSNVGAGAVDVPASITYPAIALARVDLPAGTTNITQGMLTDLRTLPRPRRQEVTRYDTPTASNTSDNTTANGKKFPVASGFSGIEVPAWATHVHVIVSMSGLLSPNLNSWGKLWVALGEQGAANTQLTPEISYDSSGDGNQRLSYTIGAKLSVPAAMRGQIINVSPRARRQGGGLRADGNSNTVLQLVFVEQPVVE